MGIRSTKASRRRGIPTPARPMVVNRKASFIGVHDHEDPGRWFTTQGARSLRAAQFIVGNRLIGELAARSLGEDDGKELIHRPGPPC